MLPTYHYKDVFETPNTKDDGTPRIPDDFNPRAALQKAFENGELSEEGSLEEFCNKYIVEKKLAESYLAHLHYLKHMKEIRSNERQKKSIEENQKSYKDYDWMEMCRKGELGKLKVKELDKYLKFNKLSERGLKADKVRRVMFHLCSDVQNTDVEIESEEEETDSFILARVIDSDLSESDSDESVDENMSDSVSMVSDKDNCNSDTENTIAIHRSRSGRQIKHTYLKDYIY